MQKRLARSGADFLFLPIRCGVQSPTQAATPSPPGEPLLARYQARWVAGEPLYGRAPRSSPRPDPLRVLFASHESCLVGPHRAASTVMRMLGTLADIGYECRAICTSRGVGHARAEERTLSAMGAPCTMRDTCFNGYAAQTLDTVIYGVPTTFLRHDNMNHNSILTYMNFIDKIFLDFEPGILLVCRGRYRDAPETSIVGLAKRRDIVTSLWLHALNDWDEGFWPVDYCLTATDYARKWYWEKYGLSCQVLPAVVDHSLGGGPPPRCVGLLDPHAVGENSAVTAAIAEKLKTTRPDIPLAVLNDNDVQGTKGFYALTKVLVVLSMANVEFGVVISGALANGIPTLVGSQGVLPELVSDPGAVVEIASAMEDGAVADAFVGRIVDLWDDSEAYARSREVAYCAAQRWLPKNAAEAYREFFGSACSQPGPPYRPR